MYEKRDELALTYGLDGKIYSIGGFGGELNQCLNTVERYDPLYQKWEKIAPLNKARRALCAVTGINGIYAIGGFDGKEYLNCVERYDEGLGKWVFMKNMHFRKCTFSAVVDSSMQFFYIFGGFDNEPLDCVERYDIQNNKWEIRKSMPRKRFMHCSVIL
ncbi:kelch motif family protein, putative [Ichthyophthirius multifiliis]|uniref:Kelch motif family protein, putative n=1 Tax=Ichthyophthirius multifiliis TaxID=5932 RepID=G0QM71_ICHMU|nr:kelch motif family protein, putative [Ichthyophthirius multifiliis]EGR33674.1 kelch motif family protein, putative [Ichthyophthirius multifiliis]|eukprot:XP_004037660.1 kelch motif family protein, putative [Ichthyophthirius multifiliis]